MSRSIAAWIDVPQTVPADGAPASRRAWPRAVRLTIATAPAPAPTPLRGRSRAPARPAEGGHSDALMPEAAGSAGALTPAAAGV
jgi:hypothetical protein